MTGSGEVPSAAGSSPTPADLRRAGFVALIGAPNAGKSTLLNRLVGSKLSIVTHKVQTTRMLVRGIVMHAEAQVIFVDTPGIFEPRRRLERAMVSSAWSGAQDADLVCLLLDARKGLTAREAGILARLKDLPQPKILVLNKIDVTPRPALLELAAKANEAVSFTDTFMVSAQTGEGCADLLDRLAAMLPPGPYLYPEDDISDLPQRLLASEITREKLTLRLHEELPYTATVETESWQVSKNGSVRIEQTIYVERETQRRIVLGKGGQAIKSISMAARRELCELLGVPVHLFLFVKVREHWADDPERYRAMGLDFPS